MFRRSRTCIVICLLLIGTCSSVFAIDFWQALEQAQQSSSWIWSIFRGKSQVTNLYKKALKLVKDREVQSTSFAMDALVDHYSSTCNGIKNIDFINVLFNTNIWFKTTFIQIFPKNAQQPSKKEIEKSYQKFFLCENKSGTIDLATLTAKNNEINTLYYENYANNYTLSTVNQKNYWSDLLWNGSLDDSDFDILYDIGQVGKMLFDDFKDTPEVLFYRLPESQDPSARNGGDLSSLSDQNSYQVWAGASASSASSWAPDTSSSSSTSVWSSTTTPVVAWSSIPQDAASLISDDKEVQTLIDSTKSVLSSTPAGVALLFGNQCLSWETATSVVEEEVPLMSSEEYISGIVNFIATANLDTTVNTHLLQQFHKENPLATWKSTSDAWYADAIANTYAEKFFGEAAPGTCEYSCRNMPLDEQVRCEFSCSKACIQSCDATRKTTQTSCARSYDEKKAQCDQLSAVKKAGCITAAAAKKTACITQTVTDAALCTSDCACSLISGPNGKWWEKMEDMFSIKFCKVPVQQAVVNPWKKVFTIQSIFHEIYDVLAWLKDSGQTAKFAQKKEFLDGNIKTKFADLFAFKLQVNFKPLFTKKSTTVQAKEQEEERKDFNLWVIDMNVANPDADDYNKYIVIADPPKNDADMEEATTIEEIQANVQKFQAALDAAKTTKVSDENLNAIIDTYAQENSNEFMNNMITFLEGNQSFWNDLMWSLFEMNKMSLELKAKIDNSK